MSLIKLGNVMNNGLDQDLLSELVEIMGGDMQMLINAYINDTREKLVTMNQLQVSTQQEDIHRLAHSLKGSSRNVGLVDFADYCEEIEKKAREGELTEEFFDLPKFDRLFESAASELAKQYL